MSRRSPRRLIQPLGMEGNAIVTLNVYADIEARRQQYGYYRDRLLDFPRKAGATRSMFWILDIGSMSA